MFFKKKDKAAKNAPLCVLLDSNTSRVLARGALEGPMDGLNMQINIIEGDPLAVVHTDHIQIVPADEAISPKLGHVIHYQGTHLVLEPLRELVGNTVRANLRMPVDFDTFIYPTDGSPGRYKAKSNDLSCGGISFYTSGVFKVGDIVEVVVPITRGGPLLLGCELLRISEMEDGSLFYAAKFTEVLNEQESMLREAVFNVQLKSIQRTRR
ncbi:MULTISPECIES: PilZ domain-containing protein [unclassified Acutalibacter]|jgi:hypothetical protein|uniref:PilZ domain-containing protein n=1 Tax=unclassified Acutalibacter TaxID=2620728 RepID=UPI001373097F|nr:MULTISPECIES: PilZ domain-containing protein [unclassified Acutalibacter]MCI9224489.1 PilZ domain-containing protein [Acutalibacter sp.]NBJ90310.1 PilZ domain-containing protein [Acutalibacter sp. 1XD8-36]